MKDTDHCCAVAIVIMDVGCGIVGAGGIAGGDNLLCLLGDMAAAAVAKKSLHTQESSQTQDGLVPKVGLMEGVTVWHRPRDLAHHLELAEIPGRRSRRPHEVAAA